MKTRTKISLASLLLAGVFVLPATASAERVLRVTESTQGEADPQKPADLPGSMLMINIYDYLVTAQPGGTLAPSLAKSWTVSPDGLNYTFALRDDVTFHDGGKFSAKDVVFTVKRMQALKRGVAFLFPRFGSAEPTAAGVAMEPNRSGTKSFEAVNFCRVEGGAESHTA